MMVIRWQEGTILGGWAVAIARATDHYELDTQTLFKTCGIDLAQALDTNARFPVTRISRLLQLAVEHSGDENFGLMVAKYIRPTSWHALGISIWASHSMRESFFRLTRYQRMFHTALEIKTEERTALMIMTLRFPEAYAPLLCDADMDAIMATTVLTCRHLAEGNFSPLQVQMCRPRPANAEGFERLFHCPVIFSSDENLIIMDRQALDVPLPTRNAELAMLNDRLIQEYLTRLDRHDIVNQVYSKLMATLGRELPDQEQLASALYLSQRSLQRKLHQAGTSYQEILDHIRHELSMQYLQQSHLSVNEISYRLGFSKVGSFTRAFRRWSGQSPSGYRERILADA
ncbi:MAG: AraC family transcriptional regulator [Marinobacter sp.]